MKEFVVIGLGRFGASVARTLSAMGYSVLGVDISEARTHALVNEVDKVVQADATDEEALRALGIRNFDVVVVSIGDLEPSILVTVMAKEMGARCVIAKARSDLHGRVLSKIGADRVVYPERDMGVRVAHNLAATNILDYIELSPDYSIMELTAGPYLAGKTLRQLDLRHKFGVNVVVIKNREQCNLSPRADDRIEIGDVLVIIGSNEGLRRLEKLQAIDEERSSSVPIT